MQARVDTEGGPLALEPVGFDQARLAAKAQPFEHAVNREIAVVRPREDAVHRVMLEQPRHHRGERLRRQSAAMPRGREGDADLSGLRLVRHDPRRAIAAQRSSAPLDGGQLHPGARIAERNSFLRRDEPFRVRAGVRRVPGLVPRDARVAPVGGEGRRVLRLKRPQHQSRGHDLEHRTILLPGGWRGAFHRRS